VARLRESFELAVVTSSALSRLEACLDVTGLSEFFAPERRFSAEDSLPRPTSKPDPAVYRLAAASLHLGRGEALAIEDSVNGTRSAVGAGLRTVGSVQFVHPDDRRTRVRELTDAGALSVVRDLSDVVALLRSTGSARPSRVDGTTDQWGDELPDGG
jgi:beta-phosphoglucomutase-like phosphatase (HAD superfamily)